MRLHRPPASSQCKPGAAAGRLLNPPPRPPPPSSRDARCEARSANGGALDSLKAHTLAGFAALCVAISPPGAVASAHPPVEPMQSVTEVFQAPTDPYARELEGRSQHTSITSSLEDELTQQFLRDHQEELFTKDAWLGMKRLIAYGSYVDSIAEKEDEPGCEMCTANRQLLEEAWQVVANEYFDPATKFTQADWAARLESTLRSRGGVLKSQQETWRAAKEMVAWLGDPYSEFLDPVGFRAAIRRPTKAELDYMATQAVGVGMKLGTISHGNGRIVVATMSGSAAEEAGIRIGDVVMSIEGVPASQLSHDEIKALLRGPVGSDLNVVVRHASLAVTHEDSVNLLRRPLQQVAATHEVVRDPMNPARTAQYIRINYFCRDATDEVLMAITEGEAQNVDSYIVDLRNNPGGVFEESIAIASFFLDTDTNDATVVNTVRSMDASTHRNVIDGSWTVSMSPSGGFPRHAWGLTGRPMAILTNAGSASASEVLAGALQDHERAVVIGERTFGKGVVQYFFRLEDSSGLKLTVAKYLTPNLHDVALEGGITPDMVCHDNPRSLLPGGTPDNCIRRALHYMAAHPVFGTPGL